MTRPIAVLRPEPGNAATAARVEALGLIATRLPLFATRAVAWTPPDPAAFDALVLTSANAVRLAGPGLAVLGDLPVHAVGAATADAASAAGLSVRTIGNGDAAALMASAMASGVRHALFLCGRDHMLQPGGIIAQAVPVYAADPVEVVATSLAGAVALLHSARAARRLADIADAGPGRAAIRIAALSRTVAAAAGDGWGAVIAAEAPTDDALLAVAITLAD